MEKEAVELLRKQLSDTEERERKAREELEASLEAQKAKEAEAQAQAEEAQKKIAELEAANEALNAEKERAEAARNETEVKSFCDRWTSQGIPPAMVEKVKPFLLSRTGRSIRLSDDAKEDTPTLKFFDELFAGLPRVPMEQIGSGETPPRELSDLEKAKKLGKAIAESVQKNM